MGGVKRVLGRGLNKARRFYLLNFNRAYVKDSLRRRKGRCLPGCGACCGDGKCKHLDKNMRCKIYKDRKCYDPFPIDATEKRLFGVQDECGYFWPGEKRPLIRSRSSRSKPRSSRSRGK